MPRAGHFRRSSREDRSGFSLLEILVAAAVLSLLVAALVGVTNQAGQAVRTGMAKIDVAQGARAGFDLVAKNLAQATLNTYWRADNPDTPRRFLRSSDLHFIIQQAGANNIGYPGTGQTVFFQAPLGHTAAPESYGGLPSLLNTVGYFVDYREEVLPDLPNPPPARWRFRLMQMLVPAERMKAFATRDGGNSTAWFRMADYQDCVQPVSDNVIAMVLRVSQADGADIAALGGSYAYDSRLNGDASPQPVTAHQMPPVVELAMVAIDEVSAARLDEGQSPPGAITAALQGLFQDTAEMDEDLVELEERLAAARVGFRTYRTSVPILESRWSEN